MSKPKRTFDPSQKRELLGLATTVIERFSAGIVLQDDPNPLGFGEYGMSLFGGLVVRFSEAYVHALRDFTILACRMLKAKSAHEKTISTLCQKAGQVYVSETVNLDGDPSEALEKAAKGLVDAVLAEAGREYVHIEPNYLVRHNAAEIVTLGRVKSMRTELAAANTALSKHPAVRLYVAPTPEQVFEDNGTALGMPSSVWVVDTPATKENVTEEAKWLIDVAVSLMRLSFSPWSHHFPKAGEIEAHPTQPQNSLSLHATIEGDTIFTGGGKTDGWYDIEPPAAEKLNSAEVQARATALFDASDRSLAQRVALGLGWMTRGRQVADRSERLLSFFTALEALLTSNDKSDPITQTISRYVSVIYTQDIPSRITIFNRVKALYSLRSLVVHLGRRDVLWSDVNALQTIVETVFWVVLHRCDLSMSQDRFAQSLADAGHGLRWEFAAPSAMTTLDDDQAD